ncbi:hypothetical protein DOTSEDRAFT_56182 [Dothistroma septosporum NZE10]|uniref:Uncharacterized protein n=1 Tax=Dothistroma septosporum (strain NZE10 / CBS 128990) TaxID=675120 RepID=N1PCP2_DOTSN|nr:hypothetical protein DOTSEDRAFT_56182 [Dothistroma septosporum NZE10]
MDITTVAAAHCDSGSEDEFHSLSVRDEDDHQEEQEEADDEEEAGLNMTPPVHPIATLQGAFEESIYESTHSGHDRGADNHNDAEMRRRELSDARRYDHVQQTRRKQRSGAKYHPLLKLMAQIVFGMHLLQKSQAKSNLEVAKILQNHVNDVDSFLERTSDDFELAITDIEERIRYLKLSMQHMDVFNAMLDEKQFRTDLLKGNDKIETIVVRTATAMGDALHDISSGLESTKELGTYLSRVEREGPPATGEIANVFAAMRGNERGWVKYLQELRVKGENLGNSLVALGNVIADINKHAAAASRRNKPQSRASLTGDSSPALRSRFAKDAVVYRKPGPWLDKPLPSEPESDANTVKVSIGKPHPVPFATRYEQPRQHAPTPGSRRTPNAEQTSPTRRRGNSMTGCGPLSSNPPDTMPDQSPRIPYKKPRRSQSQTTTPIFHASPPKPQSALFRRSRSLGAILDAPPPSTVTPQKPVANTIRKHSRTQIRYVPASGVTPVKDPVSISNGLSRRISNKLRNITPLLQSRSRNEPIARPIDSAHSSDRERSTSSPTKSTVDQERDIGKDVATGAGNEDSKSRLLLFSKDIGPFTPSQASMQSRHDTPNSKGVSAFSDPSWTSPSKPSRTLSIRKFFGHHKSESRDVAA